MGYYTDDPAELAKMNAGLPPDECVGIVYVMDELELRQEEWRRHRAEQLQAIRDDAQRRSLIGSGRFC